ncbi:MAG: hypothetical protein JO036_15915 [Candidatus Eremiobacteraeota bacterium]|nr:hypothetical protein [Candidatus Eremiobacteraeota bacterium]
MRFYRRGALLLVAAVALASCQGGGASPPPFSTGQGLPPSVTATQSIGPSGGTVAATLGAATVTVIVPNGALSAQGTVALTVFGSGAPKTLQSVARKTRTIAKDAVLITEFSVTVTGATLLKPLQASLTTAPPAAGSVFRLAGFGTSFDDVDTVTFSGGTAKSDLNVAFTRMSLASNTLYAFYTEPQAEAGAAPVPVVTVTPGTANPVGMLSAATYTGSEAAPNGFPFLDPNLTFSIDNPTLGTIATTNATTGTLTTGAVDASGNVIATEQTAGRGGVKGTQAVLVSSQRPGYTGDAFSFSGTLSSTTQQTNSNITTQPQTDAATVALTSTVKGFTPSTAGAGQNAVQSSETDTYPLQTITTNTNSVYVYTAASGHGTLSISSSDAKDSNGVEYLTQYGSGNGTLDVLPEAPGAFGPNNAALTYTETDPAGFGRQRTTNADGSYTEQGHDALGDVQTITVNPDLSAAYDARQYSGFRFTATAPSGTPPRITYRVFNSSGTQLAAFNIPSWIPASMTQPSTETDADNGSQTFPAACNVPAKYGTSGNQIVQTVNRADTALGNLETLTTTTYTSGTAGPVCIQMTDSIKTFYDYTLQNGFIVFVSGNAQPLQLTSVSETLALQSAKTSGGTTTQAVARGTSSASRGASSIAPGAFAPLAFARARFEQAVRQKLDWMRKTTFNHNFMSQGVKVL